MGNTDYLNWNDKEYKFINLFNEYSSGSTNVSGNTTTFSCDRLQLLYPYKGYGSAEVNCYTNDISWILGASIYGIDLEFLRFEKNGLYFNIPYFYTTKGFYPQDPDNYKITGQFTIRDFSNLSITFNSYRKFTLWWTQWMPDYSKYYWITYSNSGVLKKLIGISQITCKASSLNDSTFDSNISTNTDIGLAVPGITIQYEYQLMTANLRAPLWRGISTYSDGNINAGKIICCCESDGYQQLTTANCSNFSNGSLVNYLINSNYHEFYLNQSDIYKTYTYYGVSTTGFNNGNIVCFGKNLTTYQCVTRAQRTFMWLTSVNQNRGEFSVSYISNGMLDIPYTITISNASNYFAPIVDGSNIGPYTSSGFSNVIGLVNNEREYSIPGSLYGQTVLLKWNNGYSDDTYQYYFNPATTSSGPTRFSNDYKIYVSDSMLRIKWTCTYSTPGGGGTNVTYTDLGRLSGSSTTVYSQTRSSRSASTATSNYSWISNNFLFNSSICAQTARQISLSSSNNGSTTISLGCAYPQYVIDNGSYYITFSYKIDDTIYFQTYTINQGTLTPRNRISLS